MYVSIYIAERVWLTEFLYKQNRIVLIDLYSKMRVLDVRLRHGKSRQEHLRDV